jgi:CHAT domain-containing protein
MVRAIKSSTTATLILLSCLSLSLGACSAIHGLVAHGTVGIRQRDLEDLRNGKLLAVRERYEDRQKTRQPELTNRELALLCDIYVKHVSISEARACLDKLEEKTAGDAKIADAINGKRALIDYLLGEYEKAAARSEYLTSDGGRYVYALSRVQLGNNQPALDAAAKWALSYQPPQVYLAANLYLATKQYKKALETLQDPERRLDRDYNLSGSTDIFGYHIDPAPLRVDLFGEFGFGLLDTFSYAPRSNIYVEYTLAKAELELAKAELEAGQIDKSRERIDKARKRYDTILYKFQWVKAYRDVEWRALSDRARISELDSEIDRAIELYQQSIDVIESARASITTDAGRIGFVGNKQEVYGHLVRLLLARDKKDKKGKNEAFEYSERARSRALVDLLASVDKFGARGPMTTDSTLPLRNLERAESDLSDAQVTVPPQEVKERTRAVTRQGQEILAVFAPETAVLVAVPHTPFDKIRASLEPEEGLLSYYNDGRTWRLFLVKKQQTEVRHELLAIDSDSLERDVRDFRKKLESGEEYDELSNRLYKQLIAPVEKELPAKLTIVPYGKLYYLPFAALKAPKPDDKFLIQKYTISVLPSADVRQFMIPQGKHQGGVLAFGNPARDDIDPLPYAEEEAMVAYKARGGVVRVGKEATKKVFLDQARTYHILHIASHGQFNAREPLRSRLLLAPDENGDLTVINLLSVAPPWNVTLAVLSACESVMTDVKEGQDIIGLQRGFLYAGTDGIIGTLWPIRDKTTVFLMQSFYDYLNQGRSRAEALRLAQIQAIKRGIHPRDWAAFTYTGLF